MLVGAILLVIGLVFTTGLALVAFFWAARTGQFRNLHEAASEIFDAAEPAGMATDRFPLPRSGSQPAVLQPEVSR